MAKVYTQKARKQYICCKCQEPINPGEPYKKIVAMYRKDRNVCSKCTIARSELTSSDYLATIYDMEDNLSIECSDDVDSLVSDLEDLKSDLEDRLENIPEQLRDADAGMMLQERIEAIDTAIGELESLDWPEEPEESDAKAELDRADYDNDESYDAAVEEELEKLQNDYQDKMDDIVSEVGDILSNLEV